MKALVLAALAALALAGCGAQRASLPVRSGIDNAPTALCHFGPVGCVINGVPQWTPAP